jgi:cation diffusion facilitator CzcD-associated flavoprotein CzcO
VPDDELRRKLTPDHPFGCKRLVFATEYLQTLTKPHVEVVSSPARYLRTASLVTEDGTEVDVDVVLCATGYAAADYLGQIDVVGEGGTSLRERWSDGAYAYLGMVVPGIPNFFMLYGPNTNQGANSIIYILEAGARLIASAVSRLARRGGFIDVHPDVERRFNEHISAELEQTIWTRCDSYYRSPSGRIVTQWPHSELDYARATWRVRSGDWLHSGAG